MRNRRGMETKWYMGIFTDRIFRLPRIWSNQELAKFAHLFHGDVANVSAWKDYDKNGRYYREYFSQAQSYTTTNYKAEVRGFQGEEGEIFLDLEAPLPAELRQRFDVVFNHTVLEHVYDVQSAFKNLCDMTKDIVILCVPFLQEMHTDYGDYWRFTPLALRRMFEERGLTLLYLNFNKHWNASVYVFVIASKQPERWQQQFTEQISEKDSAGNYAGAYAILNVARKVAPYSLRKLLRPFAKVFRVFY